MMGLGLGARGEPSDRAASNIGERLMRTFLTRFARSESGATAIEYGLIVALIAVVIIGAVTLVGTNMSTQFNSVASNI